MSEPTLNTSDSDEQTMEDNLLAILEHQRRRRQASQRSPAEYREAIKAFLSASPDEPASTPPAPTNPT